MAKGLFITFEGPDGSGKTTQWKSLVAALVEQNIVHMATREPGGTVIGERMRGLFIDPTLTNFDPVAELFLVLANRAQNLAEIVRPTLAAGKIVVSDRHRDSSVAFQGGGRELGIDWVEHLNEFVCGETKPDCTILLDIPVEISLERARREAQDGTVVGEGDRFEQEQRAFHERIYQAYHHVARQEPDRFLIIDARGSKEEVMNLVFTALAARYPRQLGKISQKARLDKL